MKPLTTLTAIAAVAITACNRVPSTEPDAMLADAVGVSDVPAVDLAQCLDDLPTVDLPDAADAQSTNTDGGVFPPGSICNDSGALRTPPARIGHVIMIVMSTQSLSSVLQNPAAPFFNTIARQCGYSIQFLDNLFVTPLPDGPHYFALTSGSNCNVGLGDSMTTPTASGCITDDGPPSTHMLDTDSIFGQAASFQAYLESMPATCDPTSVGAYASNHNPPIYYTRLNTMCEASDLPIAHINCPITANSACGTPSNVFTQALAADTLPPLAFVSPDLTNDMSGGTVEQGDNWLHTYLPLIFASPAYLRGDVAVYVLWDQAGTPGSPMPNLFISPFIAPNQSSVTMNLFAALRAAEDQLGIPQHLGCAAGAPPGGIGTCPAGSITNLRTIFNM